jgi:hypothetical protein
MSPRPGDPDAEVRAALDDWARSIAHTSGFQRRLHVAEKITALEGIVDDPTAECEAALARVNGNGKGPAPAGEPAAPPVLPFVTGDRLAELTPAEPDYVVEPFLARGCIVQLAGKVKGGKTTLAMHAAAAVIYGRAFLVEP